MPRTAAKKPDPFADDPFVTAPETDSEPSGDEAQTELPVSGVAPWDDEKDTKDEKEKIVVVGNDGKLTTTLKGGTGYNAPWIVVHSKDVEDALSTFRDPALKDLMDIVQRAAKVFDTTPTPSSAPQTGNVAQAGKPAGATQPPNGEKKFCAHGEMEFKTGISKAGKPYALFSCTERDRDRQCRAQFPDK